MTYARSSDTSDPTSTQSAYVYAANYSAVSQSAGNFDASKLKVVGIAEIVGVTEGDLQANSYETTNPFA